jgi:glycosyltransferase involved in cell wall biosynthesis
MVKVKLMSNPKNKVLILPAWYPTKEDPVAGSFFKEQAEALLEKYDIFIALVTFPPFTIKAFARYGFRHIRISIDTSSILLPEIHCVAYAHLPERILRFFIRRNCFKGKILGSIGRRIEDHYDRKRCHVYKLAAKTLEMDFNFKPDLIYATAAQTNGVEAYIFSKSINTPLILAEHSPFPFPGTLVTAKMKEAIEGASAVLAVSNHLSRLILTQGIDCSPVIIGNMIDESAFTLRPEAQGPAGSRAMRILFVGAYSYFKDYDTLFKTIARLKQIARRQFSVTIVGYNVSKGYSQGEDIFLQHLAKYDIADVTELIPKASRNEMVNYYKAADLLVSTSVQETFGLSCLEAMACGVPVFATRSGGVEDFIDQDCGKLVNIKDYEGMAESIEAFFRGELVFNAKVIRQKAVSEYGVGVFIRQISQVFGEAMGARV